MIAGTVLLGVLGRPTHTLSPGPVLAGHSPDSVLEVSGGPGAPQGAGGRRCSGLLGLPCPRDRGKGERLAWDGHTPLPYPLVGHQPSPLHLRLPDDSLVVIATVTREMRHLVVFWGHFLGKILGSGGS